jgi:uncharacterized protein (TIGR03066 family)
MKTRVALSFLALVALFVAGCGASPQTLIVGKWEASGPVGGKLVAEFTKDGKAKMTMPIIGTVEGTYKINGDELEWTMGSKTTKYKMKVTATELSLTEGSTTITYKKVV